MINKTVPLFLLSSLFLFGEDFVLNLDNDVKNDFEVVKIENKLKDEILQEKLHFYKNSNNSQPREVKTIKKETFVPETSVKAVQNFIVTENKTISELLSLVGKNDGNIYILKDKDFLIKEGYKIYNTEDLLKLVRLVSNFEMVLTKTDIRNTYFVNLKLKEDIKTLSIEAKVDLKGLKTLLMSEYGLKVLMSNELANDNTQLHLFGTYTITELLEDLQRQMDIWFDLKDKKLFLAKTKEVLFDIKRDGEFSIDFTKQSSASTGAEDAGGDSSTGFTFKIEDYSAEKFLATLKENFPKVEFKKSYSGFLIADVTPVQYADITNYFKNVEARHELITGEILLLNFSTNDQFKYDLNWTDFLIKYNLLKVGANGTLFLDKMNQVTSGTTNSTGFNISMGAKDSSGNTTQVGFLQALSQIGEVSIVDKWTISTATGVPTGFTNYQKVPYYTVESDNGTGTTCDPNTDPTCVQDTTTSNANTYKLRYALTGFKSTFRVNKTKDDAYVIDGAVDFSGITGWESDNNGSKAPSISGKSMRIYSEFKELNKTIVIGGFKNLSKEDDSARTPFMARIPLLGWLFKSQNTTKTEQEFILLIKLNNPTIMDDKNVSSTYKKLDNVDSIRERAQKERDALLGQW